MTSADLLWACRELAARLELVGADVVEVIPSAPLGATDVTALVAARIAHELLTGLALYRSSTPAPSRCARKTSVRS